LIALFLVDKMNDSAFWAFYALPKYERLLQEKQLDNPPPSNLIASPSSPFTIKSLSKIKSSLFSPICSKNITWLKSSYWQIFIPSSKKNMILFIHIGNL